MLCEYGCGKKAVFTLKNGRNCCARRPAGCDTLKKINSEKTKEAHSEGRHGYTWNPNSAWSKGKSLTPNEEIFTENSRYSNVLVKTRIIKDSLLEYRCSKCSIVDTWQGESIILDLDHINGNNKDNRLNNLRFLCPNCHSQTDTYKGRNRNNGKVKVTDRELLTALENCSNIRQTLIEVGLTPKGGNYTRIKKTLKRSNTSGPVA